MGLKLLGVGAGILLVVVALYFAAVFWRNRRWKQPAKSMGIDPYGRD